MREKGMAAVLYRGLVFCVLALYLNVLTASAADVSAAEGYEDVRKAGTETEITVGISGYIELPAEAAPEDPEPSGSDSDDGTATVTNVSGSIRKAAPQTGDAAHPELFILPLMLAGLIICRMIRQAGIAGTQ